MPECVSPLVMNFPHPFMVNHIQATLSRSDRSIKLVLPKAMNEPWPRHFGQKPLWKVEELNPWQNSTEDMMKHSLGMMDGTQLSKAMADYPHTFEVCVAQSGGYPEVPEPKFLAEMRKQVNAFSNLF